MPRGRRGQLHAGTIGLFDDSDELEVTSLKNNGRAALLVVQNAKKAARPEDAKLTRYCKLGFRHRIIHFFASAQKGLGRQPSACMRGNAMMHIPTEMQTWI
ncbi:hypothetical protein DPSP01_012179 [Paraphaeosphaeria sporulosa]|uniref:Uncharacterized protein n=1 Tax=Paraphaeosphaeria sporulosa TaxID=1460663 RepID=A0A177C192_9PLEO|nr:uncharacterized protein CC84DRAFT_1263047 [Paraphaeosphaeria sporulosa]OAG00981.1 hypothetical protein CC84DRAFT_1263047 [Paraphaeosphaeria sporulosa]